MTQFSIILANILHITYRQENHYNTTDKTTQKQNSLPTRRTRDGHTVLDAAVIAAVLLIKRYTQPEGDCEVKEAL